MLGCGSLEGVFNVTSDHKRLISRCIVYFILAAIIVFRIRSCSSTPNAKIAQEGVAHFRSQMEAGEFQAIYGEADEGLRQKYDEEDFVQVMAAISRGTGALNRAKLNRAQKSLFSRQNKYVKLD